MFSTLLYVFISLSLSAFTAQAAPAAADSCLVANVKTVTVTLSAATATSSSSNGLNNSSFHTSSHKKSTKKNSKNGGKSNTSSSSGKKGSSKKGSSGKKGSSKKGSGKKGSSNTSSSSASGNLGSSNSTDNSSASNQTSTATPNNPDLQNSLTLDQSVVATGFLNDGQAVQEAGQVPSLTSGNNFINFCATVPNQPITNGQQITTGSCNPAPMGSIPSKGNMPSAKFTSPQNFGTIPANQAFTISLAINNLETGNFVNAQQNYFSAPQQLNNNGQIVGHSHVVVEALDSLTQSTPTDPTKFAFFKGLNSAAVNGVVSADVTAGLPAGTYKVSSINTAANHQPVLVPIAQHGSVDDVVYFTVSDNGSAASASATSGAAATSSASASASASASSGKGSKSKSKHGKRADW